MKKIWNFLRSMRFGIILLTLIAALSLPGTVIEQGMDRTACMAEYGAFWGGLFDTLGFNHVFSTWYFVALFALLCLNLVFCSIVRFGQIKNRRAALIAKAEKNGEYEQTNDEALRGIGKREIGKDTFLVNGAGFYGSFITHLGLLMLLVTAALVFSLQDSHDLEVKVGQSGTLPDGTVLTVNAFDMKNVSGETDYISTVTLTHPGKEPEEQVVRVNQPVRFGDISVYQQSYNMNAAEVECWTDDAPDPEPIELDGSAFLSLDDTNGVRIDAIYPDYEVDENGQIAVAPTYDGSLKNPCYLVTTVENGKEETGIALPGTTLYAGGVYVRLPGYYPVFNIKYLPAVLMPLMYAAFVLLIIGLYLCFFAVPKVIALKGNRMILTPLK